MEIMKEKTLFYKNQYTALVTEVNILRDSTKMEEVKNTLKKKDSEIETLKHNLDQMKTSLQQLTKKNRELERTIEILNNTEALYLEDNVSSDELDEMDWEEAKRDENSRTIDSHSQ